MGKHVDETRKPDLDNRYVSYSERAILRRIYGNPREVERLMADIYGPDIVDLRD